MRTLIMFAIVGFAAQMVDGTLGMAFGLTASTLLIATGVYPAVASAVVHTVELGTTAASGLSHWRFGNVDWKVVSTLGVSGFFGGLVGATILSNLSVNAARPVVAAILAAMGLWVLDRFLRPSHHQVTRDVVHNRRFLVGLGLGGGAIDAAGGGGWGPIAGGTLMSVGGTPARVVGTVCAAEFLVALGATIGFLGNLGGLIIAHWPIMLGLAAGGIIAAPIAAWLVNHIASATLGMWVGAALVVLNIRAFFAEVVSPNAGWVSGGIAVLILAIALPLLYRRAKAARLQAAEAA